MVVVVVDRPAAVSPDAPSLPPEGWSSLWPNAGPNAQDDIRLHVSAATTDQREYTVAYSTRPVASKKLPSEIAFRARVYT